MNRERILIGAVLLGVGLVALLFGNGQLEFFYRELVAARQRGDMKPLMGLSGVKEVGHAAINLGIALTAIGIVLLVRRK